MLIEDMDVRMYMNYEYTPSKIKNVIKLYQPNSKFFVFITIYGKFLVQ